MKVRHCFDGVVASAIPPSEVVLGYVDGYKTYNDLVRRFKGTNTHVLSVTTTGLLSAQIADCEQGCMTISQTVAWVKKRLTLIDTATVYGTQDTIDAVKRGLGPLDRHNRVFFFLADFIYTERRNYLDTPWPEKLPKGMCAWQFATNLSNEGHNLDASIVSSSWLATVEGAAIDSKIDRFLEAGYYRNAQAATRVG
jgi:hypothetical protein